MTRNIREWLADKAQARRNDAAMARVTEALAEFVAAINEYHEQFDETEDHRYNNAHDDLMRLADEIAVPTGDATLDHTLGLIRKYLDAFDAAWVIPHDYSHKLDDQYQEALDTMCDWYEKNLRK